MHLRRSNLAYFWREHGLALVLYFVLAVALSWPVLPFFASRLGGGGYDALHNVWIYWHTKEAFLGHQPLFGAPYLYYPYGASLLTHGLGPVTGVFSLPFWFWGPTAASNGVLLVSLWLSGYCMYLLARELQFERGLALFAGITLIACPMGLAGMLGNITKVFLGGLPLAILATYRALSLQRRVWWSATVGLALLLLLLHSGYQFTIGVLAVSFFGLAHWATTPRRNYWALFKRSVWTALGVLLFVGPLLFAILRVSSGSSVEVNLGFQSALSIHQPDLIQVFLPFSESALLGGFSQQVAQRYNVVHTLDKAIALSWVGLPLCLVALWKGRTLARVWLLFTLICVVLSLGPFLRAFGQVSFTRYNIPIALPYALLMQLPGFDFMRFPGRFMMVGYVGFGITASFGLRYLAQRFVRWRRLVVLGATVLWLATVWPVPLGTSTLPATPAFYEQLAQDDAMYGVFDLPTNPLPNQGNYVIPSSVYQIYQITHGKGIAGGYLSRTYAQHPLFPGLMRDEFDTAEPNLFVNGVPTDAANAQAALARSNYRYVVWHKSGAAAPTDGDQTAQQFITQAFPDQQPLVDDTQVQVYAIAPTAVGVQFGRNWRRSEDAWRWAASPATLDTSSGVAQSIVLEITPATIHDPQAANEMGAMGVLDVALDGVPQQSVPITVEQIAAVPLTLPPGEHTITLTLQAGNFSPTDYGGSDDDELSFAIRSINLRTEESTTLLSNP